ncbi:MAG: aminoacyl-tRNA hydrolase [Microgenomates group bacterium]
MHTLIGLGNPGSSYEKTRHNAGFWAVDALAVARNAVWKEMKKCQATVAKTSSDLFIKPTTFMNASGNGVISTLAFFSLGYVADDTYVFFDDLDIEVGSFKIQKGRGPKGHNGLLSMYQHLGSADFWHVRIGVDGRQGTRQIPPESYVLQPFSPDEKLLVQTLIHDEIVPDVVSRML